MKKGATPEQKKKVIHKIADEIKRQKLKFAEHGEDKPKGIVKSEADADVRKEKKVDEGGRNV